MIIVLLFALTLGYLGWRMLKSPEQWVMDVVKFGQWQHFHLFEITSRIFAGGLFILFADSTGAPAFFKGFGYFLILVGLGLTLFGETRHRNFAINVCPKFEKWFSICGLIAILLSLLLVNYSGLFPSII